MILFRTVKQEFLRKERKRCTDSAAHIRRCLMCPCRFLVLVEFLGERYLYGSFCPEFSFFTSPLLVNMWQYLVGWAHSNFTLSNLHRRSPLMVSVALWYTNSHVNIYVHKSPHFISSPRVIRFSFMVHGYLSRHILYLFLCTEKLPLTGARSTGVSFPPYFVLVPMYRLSRHISIF